MGEREYLLSRSKWRPDETEDRAKAHYKIPSMGDQVLMTNMSSRPELNGSAAEILSNGADREGFFLVRLLEGGHGGARRMKGRPSRLAPLARGDSTPNLHRGGFGVQSAPSSAASLRSSASYSSYRSLSTGWSYQSGLSQSAAGSNRRNRPSRSGTASNRGTLALSAPIDASAAR